MTSSIPLNKAILILGLLLFATAISSCNSNSNRENGEEIARVYDNYLYSGDIVAIVPKGASESDSIEIVRSFVNNWIKEQLVLHQADINLPEEKKDFSRQLKEYENSLLTYKYKSEYVRQNLDTIVTEEQVANYYENNKTNFELKNNIVKVAYVKVGLESPNLRQVKNFIQSDDQEDKQKLMDYCQRYAINFYLDDETWLLFNDVLKEIPIKTYNQEEYLKNNRYIEFKDSIYHYFVNIKGFMIKESVSPLNFEKERIRTMIINKRKLELISKLEDDIFNDALEKGNFETFEMKQ